MNARKHKFGTLAEIVKVAPPVAAPSQAVRSADPALPYFAVWFAPQRKWIRALDLVDAVAEFCASRDWGDFGASDLGGQLPLYLMDASGKARRQIGTLSYNGNVKLTESQA